MLQEIYEHFFCCEWIDTKIDPFLEVSESGTCRVLSWGYLVDVKVQFKFGFDTTL